MVSEADTHSAAQMQPSSLWSEKLFAPLSPVFNSPQVNRQTCNVDELHSLFVSSTSLSHLGG